MTALTRWRVAVPFIVFSALFLFGTALGAWAYWSGWSLGERVITVLLGVLFAAALGVSVTIGTDRRGDDLPWWRMGTVVAIFLLGCGATLIRRSL